MSPVRCPRRRAGDGCWPRCARCRRWRGAGSGNAPLLPADVDTDLVPAAWRPAVYANSALAAGAVDRDGYVVCVLEQLFKALNRRDDDSADLTNIALDRLEGSSEFAGVSDGIPDPERNVR